ncbi:MAG: ABC transporter substrate-binding protein [Candidatus Binatia bacterium]
MAKPGKQSVKSRQLWIAGFLCLFLLTPILSQGQEEKVKVGLLMINADAGIFLAQERGYFQEQGIAAEPVYFRSSSGPQMVALTTGELDVGSGSISPAVFNAVSGGVGLRVVATKSVISPRGAGRYLIRSALVDPGKQPAIRDIRGKVIGINTMTGTSRLYLNRFLTKYGLTENDVAIRVMDFKDMVGAFTQGAVDLAFMIQPFLSVVEEKKIGVPLADLSELYPGHMSNNLFFSEVFMRRRPKVAEKFILAFLKGQRNFYEAVVRKRESIDRVVDAVAKYTRVTDRKSLEKALSMTELDPNGEVKLQMIRDDQEWYYQMGLIKTKVDVDRMVDLRFLQSSVETLGWHR